MERVRIIVLNYNTANLTIKLINKLQRQVYDYFEIIVVDNSCAIDQQELLDSFLPSSIFFIKSKTNLGYSGGNNLGMKYSSGFEPDYFLILNSDLEIADNFLIQKLVNGFKIHSSLPIFAQSPLINTLSNKKPVGLQIQVRKLLSTLKLYLLSFSLFKKLFPIFFNSFVYKSEMPFENKYMICDTINGAAFIIKAEFMRNINYLDQNVFLYHEEMILGKQIQNAGGICLLNGFTEVSHLQGCSTKSSANQFNVKMERYKYLSEAYFFAEYLKINKFSIKIFMTLKEIELYLKKWLLHRK